jgi:hypothetical protein
MDAYGAGAEMNQHDISPDSRLALSKGRGMIEPWQRPEWQKFWLTVRARPWKSLALVPAGVGAPADFTLNIAVSLARTGTLHLGMPIHVADATRVPLSQMIELMNEVRRFIAAGDLVIMALAPISESPVAVSLAQSADSALICVMYEKMAVSDAKNTVNHIGAQKLIGSAVFHPPSSP